MERAKSAAWNIAFYIVVTVLLFAAVVSIYSYVQDFVDPPGQEELELRQEQNEDSYNL